MVLIIFGSYRSVLLDWKGDLQSWTLNVDPLIKLVYLRENLETNPDRKCAICVDKKEEI